MFTYFIRMGSRGPIKIGVATSLPNRLSQLQTGSPEQLYICGVIKGNHERELHDKFSCFWLRGEWFQPHQKLMRFIKNYATPYKKKNGPKTRGPNFFIPRVMAEVVEFNNPRPQRYKLTQYCDECFRLRSGSSEHDWPELADWLLEYFDGCNEDECTSGLEDDDCGEIDCECLSCTCLELASDLFQDNLVDKVGIRRCESELWIFTQFEPMDIWDDRSLLSNHRRIQFFNLFLNVIDALDWLGFCSPMLIGPRSIEPISIHIMVRYLKFVQQNRKLKELIMQKRCS